MKRRLCINTEDRNLKETDPRRDTGDAPVGVLYIVSTPIGNLEDITLRAIRVLKAVKAVAAEDTRHTQKLLNYHCIHTPLTSYHDFNKEQKTPLLLQRLLEGHDIALVSDAGTPVISDPGYYLITQSLQKGIRVVPIPGPSAVLTALSVSGLPSDRFLFVGFLPRRRAARIKRLELLQHEDATLILFESPHRLSAMLTDVREVFGSRRAVVARELTKQFEEVIRGTIDDLVARVSTRRTLGEVTVVIEGDRKTN